MSRFDVQTGRFGRHETVILRDTHTGASVEIARRGAIPLNYHAPSGQATVNIIKGHSSPEELDADSRCRTWIMAPFTNRVQNSTYVWDGQTHTIPIPPGSPDPKHVLHGFVYRVDWDQLGRRADDDYAAVTLKTQAIRPGVFEGYPFAVDVEAEYDLSADGLTMYISGRNVGDNDAPFACGWHPYFRTSEECSINELRLSVPAGQRIATDHEFIPLSGDDAYAPIESDPERDFGPGPDGLGRTIGETFIDGAFADLTPGADGYCRTRLTDEKLGRQIVVRQKRGFVHIFTGDRDSLAIEPVECLTNQFNRPECSGCIRLAPGEQRRFEIGVQLVEL